MSWQSIVNLVIKILNMVLELFGSIKSKALGVFAKKSEMLMVRLPPWYKVALAELGVSEVCGEGDNPRILEYHKSTVLKATHDSVPWCSAFACFCMDQADIKSPRSAWARSWTTWGNPVKKPVVGDVCIFRRGEGGHVGFYVSETLTDINILGGNQGDKVSITNFPKTRLLAIRRPT